MQKKMVLYFRFPELGELQRASSFLNLESSGLLSADNLEFMQSESGLQQLVGIEIMCVSFLSALT